MKGIACSIQRKERRVDINIVDRAYLNTRNMEGGGGLGSEVWSCCINKRGDSTKKGLENPNRLNNLLIRHLKQYNFQKLK